MRSPPLGMLLAVMVTTATACIPEHGPQMRPGQDCMRCHGGEGEDDAKPWTVAGTVYLDPEAPAGAGIQGATVRLTDAKGRKIDLHSNGAGNFYTRESLTFPLNVEVLHAGGVLAMPIPAEDGACNSCHNLPPRAGAPGRVYAP